MDSRGVGAGAGVESWTAPIFGANVRRYMNLTHYPFHEEAEGERIKTSVRLLRARQDDIKLLVELWNALDKALKKKRRHKWKPASVIERLIAVGIDGFWHDVGGRPDADEDRAEFLRRAIEEMNKIPREPKNRPQRT